MVVAPVTGARSSIYIFDSDCFGYRGAFLTVLQVLLIYLLCNSLSIADKDAQWILHFQTIIDITGAPTPLAATF